MVGPRTDFIGSYATPYQAAYAVAHFQTGNPQWDMMPELMPAMADRVLDDPELDVLKLWTREDEPSPDATEPEAENV
jgi:hypothetical protein